MNNYNKKVIPLIISFLLFSITAGCSHTTTEKKTPIQNNSENYNGQSNAVTIFSEEKKYKVTLYSNLSPLSTGKVHDWTLQVLTPNGKPIENIKIYVHGGMPIHQHGFPTKPRVTKKLGNGLYLVSGVKFSMPGEWEMRFNLKEKNKRDRVIFKVNI